MATKVNTKTKKAVVKKPVKKAPTKVAPAPKKKAPAPATVAPKTNPKPCPPAPPCPELPDPDAQEDLARGSFSFQTILDALNAPLEPAADDPSADSDAHFTRTPLVDIPEFAAATARYDLVRSYVKALEEIKDRLSDDLKTWMGLGGLEATVAMGFKLETVTTERKTFDRDRAVTVAHLTEEQIEASMKISKSTQLRVTQLKPRVEEAQ